MRTNIIKHRFDGLICSEGSDININGDPDKDGAPRTDSAGYGLNTGSSTTRKSRDTSQTYHGVNLFINRGTNIDNCIQQVLKASGVKPDKGKLSREQRSEVTREFCRTYWDARMFGAVLNVGKSRINNVNGVVTVHMGRSRYPIEVQEHSITRVCETNDEQGKDQEMGTRFSAEHGVYLQSFTVNPFHAEMNGATNEDLAIFLDSLVRANEWKQSSMAGRINLRGLWLFKHESKYGNAMFHDLIERVQVSSEDPEHARSWNDYDLRFDDKDLPSGITVIQLEQLLGGVDKILPLLD